MKKWLIGGTILAAFVVTGGVVYLRFHTSPSPAPAKATSSSRTPTHSPPHKLDHIFVLVEENKAASDILGNPSAPYLSKLAQTYAVATNYYAVTHPSLPNYIALTSGSTNGITTDCNPPSAGCEVNVKNIADELEAAHLSWKEYAESMPSACYAFNAGDYATKHNPYLYYSDIINNKARCTAHDVPFSQLPADLKSAQTTPEFAFITPNLCNDMHNCPVATGDNWLRQNVPLILSSPAFTKQHSALVITWDENDGGGNNHVAAILAGSAVKRGFSSATTYDHYSLLRTIETNWNLPPLTTNDQNVAPMTNFFN